MVIYTGHDRLLYESRLEYKYDMANELFIGWSAFLYINFAGNIENHEAEHMIGNFTCGFLSLVLIFNFPIVIYTNYKHLRLVSRKYYRRTPC